MLGYGGNNMAQKTEPYYTYTQASTIRWALENELSHITIYKDNDNKVEDFLKNRIKELKEIENKWNTKNSKG